MAAFWSCKSSCQFLASKCRRPKHDKRLCHRNFGLRGTSQKPQVFTDCRVSIFKITWNTKRRNAGNFEKKRNCFFAFYHSLRREISPIGRITTFSNTLILGMASLHRIVRSSRCWAVFQQWWWDGARWVGPPSYLCLLQVRAEHLAAYFIFLREPIVGLIVYKKCKHVEPVQRQRQVWRILYFCVISVL